MKPELKVVMCLHPTELVSMLQFWVPRREKFEKAIIGNFRLPFLFREIDSESEKVSLEILRALSLYEGSSELSNEMISEILTNKALRQKIKPSNTIETNAEILKDELTQKIKDRETQIEKELSDKQQLEQKFGRLERKFDSFLEEWRSHITSNLQLKKQLVENERRIDLQRRQIDLSSKLGDIKKRKRIS